MDPPKNNFGVGSQFKWFHRVFVVGNTGYGRRWGWCSRYSSFYLIESVQHVRILNYLSGCDIFDVNYLFTFEITGKMAEKKQKFSQNFDLNECLMLSFEKKSFLEQDFRLSMSETTNTTLEKSTNGSEKAAEIHRENGDDGDKKIEAGTNVSLESEENDNDHANSTLGSFAGDVTVVENDEVDIPELSKESIDKIMEFKFMAKRIREKDFSDKELAKWEFSTEKVSALKAINKTKMFKITLENIGIPKNVVGLRPMKDTIYELLTDVDHLALPVEIISNHDLVNEDKNPRQVNGVQFEDGLNHKFTLKIYTYVHINADILYGNRRDWEIGEGHNRWHVMLPGYQKEPILYARAYCPDYNLPCSEILKAVKKSGFMVLGDVLQYESANQKNMPGFVKSGSVKNFRYFYPAAYLPNEKGEYDDIEVQVYSKYFKSVITLKFNVYDKSKPAPKKCIACNQDANICRAVKDDDVCIYRQITIGTFKKKLQKLGQDTDYITPAIRQETIQAQTTEKEQEYLQFYFRGIQSQNEISRSKRERIRCIVAFEGEKVLEAERERIRKREQDENFTEVKTRKKFEATGTVPKSKPVKNKISFTPTVSFHAICSRKNLIGLTKENVMEGIIKAPIDSFQDSYAKCFFAKFDVPKMVMILKKIGAWNEKLQDIGESGSITRQRTEFSEEIGKAVKVVCSKNVESQE